MAPGVIHIISEIGGCVIGLPPDTEEITRSLQNYAQQHGMETLRLIDPDKDDLDDWADMVALVVGEYGAEGPVLVGTHQGERVLVGVSKRYGYPIDDESLEDIISVSRVP